MKYLVSYMTEMGGRNGLVDVEATSRALAITAAILKKHNEVGNKEEFGGIYWESFQVEKQLEELCKDPNNHQR